MYNIKIAHHNIRSLSDKIHELKIFITTHNPDIITLNETYKIKPTLKIPNYTITQPINNIDKGVAIIHKNNLNVDLLPQPPTNQRKTYNIPFSFTPPPTLYKSPHYTAHKNSHQLKYFKQS